MPEIDLIDNETKNTQTETSKESESPNSPIDSQPDSTPIRKAKGGFRPGAGRPRKDSVSLSPEQILALTPIGNDDPADPSSRGYQLLRACLSHEEEVSAWRELLKSKDKRLMRDALIYLSDRAYGKATNQVDLNAKIQAVQFVIDL